MDERLESIIITDLPDGAIDSILSVICSWTTDDMREYCPWWKDVMNFRLVCKSFQKLTDRVVPSFALYQQLFNKGVDPSIWITKQEEELTAKFSGFVYNSVNFRFQGGKSCNPLLLPDLSSMPLLALESLINVKIHELLISDAALKSMIKIAYAFPSSNTVGFTLTLPNSSLHPGKQLAFQVTNRTGSDVGGAHFVNWVIMVQVDDVSLAKALGLAPFKSHLMMNEATSYNNGQEDGERFIKNLSYIMPVYSAQKWIHNLLQVGNQHDLPYSNDEQDSMDVDTEFYIHEDEWLRRTEPTTFDCSLPIFSNQTSHSVQLQRMPLLPGSVVNQILNPSGTSLLQLIMMNKLVLFYRLNKCHKQLILSNLLSNNSHPGYQSTVKQIFDHLTVNESYSMHGSISQFSIHLGALNEELWGCYFVVDGEYNRSETEPVIHISTIDSRLETKVAEYFGERHPRDHGEILATLHLQQLLRIEFILPPIDIISLFVAVLVPKIECVRDRYFRNRNRKQWPALDTSFDLTQVDPSCTLSNVKVYEENGVPFSSVFINNSAERYFYIVLQALQSNDHTKSFGHIRFGYKKELFSTEENEVSEYHFKITNQYQNTDLAKQLYDYWICRLPKPIPKHQELISSQSSYDFARKIVVDQSHVFSTLSVKEENALSFEILYAESLNVQLSNIKTLFKSDQLAAINQVKHLHSLLPNNIMVQCFYAKIIAQVDGCFEAIKLLNMWQQQRPFNGQLWMTKAKILETAQNFMEAIRCYSLFCDFPMEEGTWTENLLYLKAYRKVLNLFQRLNMCMSALRVWESHQKQKNLLKNLDSDTTNRMQLMQAKKYIRESFNSKDYLSSGLNILQGLPRSLEAVMLYVEAKYHLGSYEQILKLLDNLIALRPQIFDIMIHKAAILHQLKQFDQAIECYQKAMTITTNQPFDIEAAIDAAKRQQIVPWPFKIDFPHEAKVWTDEEIAMLFILHPNAVSSAREKVQVSTNTKAMQFLLNELDDAQVQMDKDKCCYAHIYPVEYLSKKIFRDIPLKSTKSTKDANLTKAIDTSRFRDSLPFIFQLHPKSKDNSTLLWYPTHPCTIPFLLANGISPDEHGVTFYESLSSCSHDSYYEDDYSVPFAEGYDKAYISMALLVEVDSVAAEKNIIHEKPKDSFEKVSHNKFPMTTIHSKSHIGTICYLAIIIGTKWDAKICLVSNQSTLCD